MVDLFASEYGWTCDYILTLAPDVVEQLNHAILYRHRCAPTLRRPQLETAVGTLGERMAEILDLTGKTDG